MARGGSLSGPSDGSVGHVSRGAQNAQTASQQSPRTVSVCEVFIKLASYDVVPHNNGIEDDKGVSRRLRSNAAPQPEHSLSLHSLDRDSEDTSNSRSSGHGRRGRPASPASCNNVIVVDAGQTLYIDAPVRAWTGRSRDGEVERDVDKQLTFPRVFEFENISYRAQTEVSTDCTIEML